MIAYTSEIAHLGSLFSSKMHIGKFRCGSSNKVPSLEIVEEVALGEVELFL
jgi:hypothetical protein